MQSSVCPPNPKEERCFFVTAGTPASTEMLWIPVHLETSSLGRTAAVAEDAIAFQQAFVLSQ